jgi:glycosyltransferase involved in cell wall biosynthesis
MNKDVNLESSEPFFSICIETYNRENTIQRVLNQILIQTCKDFELIIVDNGSTDETRKRIEETIKDFDQTKIQFHHQSRKNNAMSGWNSPLFFAKGKYIVICEGDDYFNQSHLENAKRVLIKNANVGLYVASTDPKNRANSEGIQLFSAAEKMKSLRLLEWCPVPSAVIFPRVSKFSRKPFLFDLKSVYAGEYLLYEAILSEGYDVVENFSDYFVERGYHFYLKDDFHMRDMISFSNRNLQCLNPNEQLNVLREINNTAIFYFLTGLAHLHFSFPLIKIIVTNQRIKKLELVDVLNISKKVICSEFKRLLYTLIGVVKSGTKFLIRY